jgi:hypothetical protein
MNLGGVIMGKGDLRDLIARHKGDRSYDRLARESHDNPTSGRWHQLATQPRQSNFPRPDTIQGVARTLGVTVTEVVMAAARSMGIDVREDDHGALSTAGLTPRQTQIVRMLISALAEKEDTSDGAPIAEDDDLEVRQSETSITVSDEDARTRAPRRIR